MRFYKAEFYGRETDSESGKVSYKYKGSVIVSDACVTPSLPLATKAFRAAPPQVSAGADKVTFTQINYCR